MQVTDEQVNAIRTIVNGFMLDRPAKDNQEIRDSMFDDILMRVIELEDESKLPKYGNREGLSPEQLITKKIQIFTRYNLYSNYSDLQSFIDNDFQDKHNYRQNKYYARKIKKTKGREVRFIEPKKVIKIVSSGDIDKTIRVDTKSKSLSKNPLYRDPLYKSNPHYFYWLTKRGLPDTNDNYITYITAAVALIDRKNERKLI